VGQCVCKCEVEEGVGGHKLETERDGLVSGCIRVLRGGGGFCGVTESPIVVI
jgi:hypothetical protein